MRRIEFLLAGALAAGGAYGEDPPAAVPGFHGRISGLTAVEGSPPEDISAAGIVVPHEAEVRVLDPGLVDPARELPAGVGLLGGLPPFSHA